MKVTRAFPLRNVSPPLSFAIVSLANHLSEGKKENDKLHSTGYTSKQAEVNRLYVYILYHLCTILLKIARSLNSAAMGDLRSGV